MPNLVYPTADFVPFTKILSSEVNGKFNAVKTLLNTTKLDYTNLQTGNLLYASQLSMQVIITDSTGLMTTSPVLAVGQGGTGIALSLSAADIQKVVQVNAAGSALTLDVAPQPPTGKVYSFYRFT